MTSAVRQLRIGFRRPREVEQMVASGDGGTVDVWLLAGCSNRRQPQPRLSPARPSTSRLCAIAI